MKQASLTQVIEHARAQGWNPEFVTYDSIMLTIPNATSMVQIIIEFYDLGAINIAAHTYKLTHAGVAYFQAQSKIEDRLGLHDMTFRGGYEYSTISLNVENPDLDTILKVIDLISREIRVLELAAEAALKAFVEIIENSQS